MIRWYPASPNAFVYSGSRASVPILAAMASGESGRMIIPVCPSTTNSRAPGISVTIQATLQAIASRKLRGEASRIHMLGMRKDDVHFMTGKDVCIWPSTRDASPRSLREAMACKVACIVTDIPGARDLVVDGRTGIIVQAGSPQAIAEGIRVLAADRAKTKMMGEAGYQRIRTEYTMEEYVRRLKGVFDAIMTK